MTQLERTVDAQSARCRPRHCHASTAANNSESTKELALRASEWDHTQHAASHALTWQMSTTEKALMNHQTHQRVRSSGMFFQARQDAMLFAETNSFGLALCPEGRMQLKMEKYFDHLCQECGVKVIRPSDKNHGVNFMDRTPAQR